MSNRVLERRRDARRARHSVGLRAVAVRLEEADRRRNCDLALSHYEWARENNLAGTYATSRVAN